ncbi:MAG: hypothetical protein HQL91_09470 [Magnetococcales bacterium]|nr:hypothetical protein [Magnetococcales bacterium]
MDKRRMLLALLAGWVALLPDRSAAFVVGEIAVVSAPAKKFRAEVPLRLGEGESLKRVTLGNVTDYKAMGLVRSGVLDDITLKTVENGSEVRLQLTSDAPLPTKGFDLLLRVSSSKQTNFPVFRIQAPAAAPEKEREAVRDAKAATAKSPEESKPASAAKSGAAKPPEESKSSAKPPEENRSGAAAKSSAQQPPPKSVAAPTVASGGRQYGPVKAGDTLTSIARGLLAKGTTLHQFMAAIYERNPDHFLSGNMNNLISGGILKIPSPEEVRAINDRQARILCMAHTKTWEQMQAGLNVPPPPQNVLLAAEEAAKAPNSPASEGAMPILREESHALAPTSAPIPASAPVSQLQSVAPPGNASMENFLVRFQSQLEELNGIMKSGLEKQIKLESRVSSLEMARTDTEALTKRVAALERSVAEAPVQLPGAGGGTPPVAASGPKSFEWVGVLYALIGGLIAGGLAWMGRRWNRQAQQEGLRQLLAVTARDYPEVAREILHDLDSGKSSPFIPTIHAGKLDGVPPPTGKKVVNGNVLQSVHRLNALEAGRGEMK